MDHLRAVLENGGWFKDPGAYVLVDGQFGSTGKGVVSTMLAEALPRRPDIVTSNAGPNSGHTGYHDGEKIVLRQLPMYPVICKKKHGRGTPGVYLNSGAVLDLDVLNEEIRKYLPNQDNIWVSPHAAIVTPKCIETDSKLTPLVGSTGKGTGAALAHKIMRDPEAVAAAHGTGYNAFTLADMGPLGTEESVVYVEVSQGYSLGLDAGFYPYCTSRNCTVGAALSDAGIHPSFLRQTIMCVRTFPIRVGGNSGPGYPDQTELTWEDLGVEPERTTVTNKVRRIFTWSDIQYQQALLANRPDYIYLNFLNYLPRDKVDDFVIEHVIVPYHRTLNQQMKGLFLGFGPETKDIAIWK